MNLNEFTTKTNIGADKNFLTRPKIVCNDGFTMSVQGHSGSYSTPRENSYIYSSMEIGFPSEKESLIMDFAEDEENPTETVYGWVDVDIIQKVIDKHRGINIKETFKTKTK